MNQFGPEIDKSLNEASHKIGEAEETIEKATKEKDDNWEIVKDIFAELGGDKRLRFVADDGHHLTLQYRDGSPKLDEAMLQALIFQKFDNQKATLIWNSITKRTIDNTALEAAIRTKKLPQSILDQCLTPAKEITARIRKEWTKADRERARILGIQEPPKRSQ